jgi:hypothetical protein
VGISPTKKLKTITKIIKTKFLNSKIINIKIKQHFFSNGKLNNKRPKAAILDVNSIIAKVNLVTQNSYKRRLIVYLKNRKVKLEFRKTP